MKLINAESLSGELHLITYMGTLTNNIDYDILIPSEDKCEFVIQKPQSFDEADSGERSWLTQFAQNYSIEEFHCIMESLIYGCMYISHYTVNAEKYSELLFHKEIRAYVDFLYNANK